MLSFEIFLGIICNSETDQMSLTRMRRSRESLDSGEIDGDEECIEVLDASHHNEEYKTLQADAAVCDDEKQALKMKMLDGKGIDALSNEQKPKNREQGMGRFARYLDKRNHTIVVPIEFEDNVNSYNDTVLKTSKSIAKLDDNTASDQSNGKNDVIFKNIFGATKNAIFRTAQSIIENHEKKNAQKSNKIDADESSQSKSSCDLIKKKDFFMLKPCTSRSKANATPTSNETTPENETSVQLGKSVSARTFSVKDKDRVKVPGVVKCFVKMSRDTEQTTISLPKIENGHNGLLRFLESPIFNIHFAIHYLFYSKEPGVLSFIANKIFSFKDQDVDLYIPQLILMYIQMDDLAEALDPYLVYRCRKAVDFALKCSWLLESYNYNADSVLKHSSDRKTNLKLIKELYPKREHKQLRHDAIERVELQMSPVKKTHHRSQSDATGLLNGPLMLPPKLYQTPIRLCLGDLSTGRAFDSGCICFESVRGTVNDLLGHRTVCTCGAPKLAAQREFVKSLIDIGRNLTHLPSKTEKTSILRMRLNLINKNLPARVWLPLNSDIPHHIVRIKEEKTAVLNSKDKTPYIIYVEVVEVNDIYTSPVIPKMMPSLRHTKSEEHLESQISTPSPDGSVADTPNCSTLKTSHTNLDVNKYWHEYGISDDDAWLPEDDEITTQYLSMRKMCNHDTISQMSLDSTDSREQCKQNFFYHLFI